MAIALSLTIPTLVGIMSFDTTSPIEKGQERSFEDLKQELEELKKACKEKGREDGGASNNNRRATSNY